MLILPSFILKKLTESFFLTLKKKEKYIYIPHSHDLTEFNQGYFIMRCSEKMKR